MNIDNRITISIYGAFDRFNYGDLLFPIVIKRALDERLGKQRYKYYGLIDSDLTRFGGVPTAAIRRRLQCSLNSDQKEVFIIAGGEVLSTSMYFIHQCLINSDFARKVFNRLSMILGKEISNNISRYLLAPQLVVPFVINRDLLPDTSCFIYNAVGGSLPEENRELIKHYLQQADFISVRDRGTMEGLTDEIPDINPHLFPDSASVISKYFPKDVLSEMISSETVDWLNNQRDGYICFQISSYHYGLNPEEIKKQIDMLSKKSGLPILLLPIGRAPWHHDQVALRSIQSTADYDCFMPSENTIWDIMALIANAGLFIGTSLHGVITSMCYSVPYVAINPNIKKVKRYLETWSNSEFNSPIKYSLICDTAMKAIDMDVTFLEEQHLNILERAELNFDAIANCIGQNT